MAKSDTEPRDMTMGVYRRIYAGYLESVRIAGMSLHAEAWFWRVHSVADDFGNLAGSPGRVFRETIGERLGQYTMADVQAWTGEMIAAGLLVPYDVDGEPFLHVTRWLARQPAGANGRRVRRYKRSPWDGEPDCSRGGQAYPGESGGIQKNPSVAGEHHNHYHDHDQDKPANAGCRGSLAASADTSDVLLELPCRPGRKNRATVWPLTRHVADALAVTYPAIDVLATARKALEWCNANPTRLRTADKMRTWLGTTWCGGDQDKASRGANRQAVVNGTSADAMVASMERADDDAATLVLPTAAGRAAGIVR